MKELLELFWIFCKTGAVTFGGGYAMLPMFQNELVYKRHWVTEEEILDYYAIGQCTPGIIAVNTATFVGYKRKGVSGALIATAGIVFPSLVIITIIAAFIQNFADLEIVQNAFEGIRVAVSVLIANAVINLWKSGVKDKAGVFAFFVVLVMSLWFNLSPILIVIFAVLFGVIIMKVKRRGERP